MPLNVEPVVANKTTPVRLGDDARRLDPSDILSTLARVRKGELSARLPLDKIGLAGKIADALNKMLEENERLRVNVAIVKRTLLAVKKGDFSARLPAERMGNAREAADIFNEIIDLNERLVHEFARISRVVGKEGSITQRASIGDVSGGWRECVTSINSLIGDLVQPTNEVARVIGAVADGDLSQTMALSVDGRAVKGEFLRIAKVVNTMVDQLNSFASEVTRVAREVGTEGKLGGQAQVEGVAGTWKDLTDNVNQLAANLTTQVRSIAEVATAVTKGDLTRSISVQARGEVAVLKDNINEMIRNLKDTTQKNTEQDWLKTNLAKFTRMLQGQRDLEIVSRLVLSELAPLISIQLGAFYLIESNGERPDLRLLGSYGYQRRKGVPERIDLGEGLLGECAVGKKRILFTAPADNVQISSCVGKGSRMNIVILPILFEGQVKAIIELASFQRFGETHLAFLDQLTESIGIVLNTIAANMRTEDLLKQSQSLTLNLQRQQTELTETNEKLEERARLLSDQKGEIERKNQEVELAKKALEEKADQLALTSKYKSQFLANMSHELRTPLNSLLILAKILYQNHEANLSAKQIDFAKTIYSSGSDLLALINEILDMSKIESGMIPVEFAELYLSDLRDYVDRNFQQIAQDRGLDFTIRIDEALPQSVRTDTKRLQQVLKNLLSNAFKFTEKGSVTLSIHSARTREAFETPALLHAQTVVAFSVEDTGIGIPPDKRKIIFEAFQQADMTTSRKYGGTGLGLTISREIATLLGGEIHVAGNESKGSVFTLFLPADYFPLQTAPKSENSKSTVSEAAETASPVAQEIPDDRNNIVVDDNVLLIIEDDVRFSRILLEMANKTGFKVLLAQRGEAAIELARKFKPDAITLDIRLPDMDGWRILDLLKHDPETRHIPVHVISVDADDLRPAMLGAFSSLQKPASPEQLLASLEETREFIDRRTRNLLVIEDDEVQRRAIVDLVGTADVETTAVARSAEALRELSLKKFDCMILDLGLSDMSGCELLNKISRQESLKNLPIIVYTERDLNHREEAQLKRLAKRIVIKDVHSPELLLDEASLYLHRPETSLPPDKRLLIERLRREDPMLANKSVLIVDDDVRNIFALTSLLEQHRVKTRYAESGKAAIEILESSSGMDVVLMDVMMPDMDGYETIRAIRRKPKFESLPIVALTAKAMKGDRDKCMAAGASDYIAKPVDIQQLLSILRVWMRR